ncbi:hypothetical protein SAMN05444161_8393 [Rhizobiales bacterium GAS191]|nr:hypothetical protein SAMN05444161_8393 [Rhizobiales bacterium GAS191]
MKMHIIIPAISSLALFAASSASASTPTANAPQGAKVEKSMGDTASAISRQQYERRADMPGRGGVIFVKEEEK